MNQNPCSALVISGFLGSGKTTFLLQLLAHLSNSGIDLGKVAIIENEIGATSIDGATLNGSGYSVTNLLSGCACCTLLGSVPLAIKDIRNERNPELLLFEATGLANPSKLAQVISDGCHLPCRVVTLADAAAWNRVYSRMTNLIEDQIRHADTAVITKVDLASEAEIAQVKEDVARINLQCVIMETSPSQPLSSNQIKAIFGEE